MLPLSFVVTTGLVGCAAPDLPVPEQDLEVVSLSASDHPLGRNFSKMATVFGLPIVATETTSDEDVLHAAHVMAQYLDNDEDGEVDVAAVLESMQAKNALLLMPGTEEELGLMDVRGLNGFSSQALYGSETNPEEGFDGSLEEILHLIYNTGYVPVWPERLADKRGSELADAMDVARGGRFVGVPASYPEEAWYHYDDRTCNYACMVSEYHYWAFTTMLGAQSDPARCEDIAHEWELCTDEDVREQDPLVHELLSDPEFGFATQLPDGSYQGAQ